MERGLQCFSVPYKILGPGGERTIVLFRAIQNTGKGGLGGERTTVLLLAIQNTDLVLFFLFL